MLKKMLGLQFNDPHFRDEGQIKARVIKYLLWTTRKPLSSHPMKVLFFPEFKQYKAVPDLPTPDCPFSAMSPLLQSQQPSSNSMNTETLCFRKATDRESEGEIRM